MQVIPLQPVPAQTLEVLLDSQAVTLELRQLSTGLYINVLVSGVEIVGFTVCENANRIIRNAYLGFSGDLVFLDNFGFNGKPPQDPDFTGLGDHFSLLYLTEAELTALGIG